MSSRRIVINTAATYGRSVLAMGMALFSSRWVLNSLGQSDFGLYSVVGSIIIFITFLNGVMAGSSARFFAFSIGRRNYKEVNDWFNTSLSIHVGLAIILVIIGLPLGEYVVRHVLNVPLDRVHSCVLVLRISLLSAFASMIAVPFVAMFTAKQHITEIAVWGVLQSVLTFILAFILRRFQGDRLIYYASGMAGIIIFIQVLQIFRGLLVFNECHISVASWFEISRFRKIFTFSAWNVIGDAGIILRDQGSAVILNVFFGPQINTSYGIATQVSWQTNQLSTAMIGAFSPEITESEGRGDRARMLSISNQASKYGTLMMLLFVIPLMIEIDYVLGLWLGNVPKYTATFCRLILARFLVDRITTGFGLALNAHGKISAYQVSVGFCQLLTLPIAWVFIKAGMAPTSVGISILLTTLIVSLGRALWARKILRISLSEWLYQVVRPCLIVFASSIAISKIIYVFMAESIACLIAVCAGSSIIVILGLIAFLSGQEQLMLRRIFLRYKRLYHGY